MRKIMLLLLICVLVLMSGCGSKVPEHLKNPKTEFMIVEDYMKAEYSIPPNYRLIKDGIYAVLDESGTVTGFMKLIEENGDYRWEERSSEEAYQ